MRRILVIGLIAAVIIGGGEWAYQRIRDVLVIPQCTFTAINGDAVTYDPEQSANAATIAAVALRRGISADAITIVLATVQQESKLRNLNYGDRDSQGLFQQRPSMGWGSIEDITTPRIATSRFYSALLRVPNWQSLDVHVAAQAVQRSADGSAYQRWESSAQIMTSALADEGNVNCQLHRFGGKKTSDFAALKSALQQEWVASDFNRQGNVVTINTKRPESIGKWLIAHAEEFALESVKTPTRSWDRRTLKNSKGAKNQIQITLR